MHDQLKAAELLLDEWKWRHQHCWKSLQRFGITALTIAAVPYIRADIFKSSGLQRGTLVFPLVAWLVSLAAAWLYTAEYTRCRPVETKYYEVLGDALRPIKLNSQLQKPRNSIGKATIRFFVIGATIVSATNALIVRKISTPEISVNYIWAVSFAAVLISVRLAFWMTDWADAKINEIGNLTATLPSNSSSSDTRTQP